MLLEVEGLQVAYGDYQVVWDVSLTVGAGETVALLGPNGSGKSSVVNAISGLVTAVGGDVRLDGESLLARPTHRRAESGVAHVLERRAVFPKLTVLENLRLGAWHPRARAARAASLERVYGLFPKLRERRGQLAGEMSGGEQQMLALGRGLMSLPRLLIVDEPFLGLAPQVIGQLREVFRTLSAEGVAILFIEQNVTLSLTMSDRAYVLESGRLVASGPSPDLRDDPRIARVFLGA
ncbi:ABC transporter ATP-binding protein [Methylopila musalis]|uniref:ABC transporter ATP-binding protein n=1 Tax=Methylopila musalis TaxID=1134781 RepID=A0ABW3Z3B2_9HYPH